MKKLEPVKIFKCGCKLFQQDDRCWTIYCKNHGKHSYPKE